jgi:hypothetical protein
LPKCLQGYIVDYCALRLATQNIFHPGLNILGNMLYNTNKNRKKWGHKDEHFNKIQSLMRTTIEVELNRAFRDKRCGNAHFFHDFWCANYSITVDHVKCSNVQLPNAPKKWQNE